MPTLPFLFFLLLSCTTLPQGSPSRGEGIFRLRGTLEVITPAGKIRGAIVLLTEGKERARVEFLTSLGGVMAVLWMAGEEWILWDPPHRSALRGTIPEVFIALPSLPPLYRNGILLTITFLALTEDPPFATLKRRIRDERFLPSIPLIGSDGIARVLYELPTGVVTVEYDPKTPLWQVSDGLWALRFQRQDLSPSSEGSFLLTPQLPPGTSWRSFSELSSSPPAPATAPNPPLPGELPPP